MTVDGFSLENIEDGVEIFWWPTLPERFYLDETIFFNAQPGWSNESVRLVHRTKEFT